MNQFFKLLKFQIAQQLTGFEFDNSYRCVSSEFKPLPFCGLNDFFLHFKDLLFFSQWFLHQNCNRKMIELSTIFSTIAFCKTCRWTGKEICQSNIFLPKLWNKKEFFTVIITQGEKGWKERNKWALRLKNKKFQIWQQKY